MSDPRLVVGAVIVDSLERPTRILAARRTSPAALAGKWEFPGGKVEGGESPDDALRRELREELSIEVDVGEELRHPSEKLWPASGGYWMRLYWAGVRGDARVVLDGSHDEARWLGATELDTVDWLESDKGALPVVARSIG